MSGEKIKESSFTQIIDQPTEPHKGENTSGMHSSVPPEISGGWNWGAFFLTWVWAIGHSVWIGLLALISPVSLIMAIILAVKGNEWAWQNRRFESIDQFKEIQRKWGIWGLVITIFLSIAIAVIMATVVLVSLGEARENARQASEEQQKKQIDRLKNDPSLENLFNESKDSDTDEL